MTKDEFKAYTGIGSRQTPGDILAEMTRLAQVLAEQGWTLRSGGALGADTAFEDGADAKQIFLPWAGLNGNASPLVGVDKAALDLAATLHPEWLRLTSGPRKLHARNCYQVLGRDLATPSKFVVCWTPDGAETETDRTQSTGGTGTAIVLASRNGVSVFNLRNKASQERLSRLLASEGVHWTPSLPNEQATLW